MLLGRGLEGVDEGIALAHRGKRSLLGLWFRLIKGCWPREPRLLSPDLLFALELGLKVFQGFCKLFRIGIQRAICFGPGVGLLPRQVH